MGNVAGQLQGIDEHCSFDFRIITSIKSVNFALTPQTNKGTNIVRKIRNAHDRIRTCKIWDHFDAFTKRTLNPANRNMTQSGSEVEQRLGVRRYN